MASQDAPSVAVKPCNGLPIKREGEQMKEVLKQTKNAPIGQNLGDSVKGTLFGLANLITFVIKLTYVIIRQLYRASKALVTK